MILRQTARRLGCAVGLVLAGVAAVAIIMDANPLHLGDPAPLTVVLDNETGTRVGVWQNLVDTDPRYSFNIKVADLGPADTKQVTWIFGEAPTYRAEDGSGRTIYCGPYGQDSYAPVPRDVALKVRITRMSDVPVETIGGKLVCQRPRSGG